MDDIQRKEIPKWQEQVNIKFKEIKKNITT